VPPSTNAMKMEEARFSETSLINKRPRFLYIEFIFFIVLFVYL